MCKSSTSKRRAKGHGQITTVIEGQKYKIRVGCGYTANGKLRQKSETVYGSRARAEVRAEELYQELKENVTKKSGYTLSDYYERVILPAKAKTSKTNLEGYKTAWKHVPKHWKNAELHDFTQSEVQAWVNTLSHGTAQSAVKYLRAVLNQAYGDNLLKYPPMHYHVQYQEQTSETRLVWSEYDIARALLAARDTEIEPYLLVVCGCGCRREEAAALKWSDIECDEFGVVWIDITKTYTEKDRIHKLKTSTSRRRIPVTGYVARRLQELHEGTGYIQHNKKGEILSCGGLRRRWSNLWRVGGHVRKNCYREPGVMLANDIPEITPNAVRHSHTSVCSEIGIDKETRELYHGHNDGSTETVHYIKRYDERFLTCARIVGYWLDRYIAYVDAGLVH